MNRRALLTLVLLAAAAVTGWSILRHRPDAMPATAAEQRSDTRCTTSS